MSDHRLYRIRCARRFSTALSTLQQHEKNSFARSCYRSGHSFFMRPVLPL